MISSNPGCCAALGQRIDYHFAAGKDCFARESRFEGVVHLIAGALLYFPLTTLIIYIVSKIFFPELPPAKTSLPPPKPTLTEPLEQDEWAIQLLDDLPPKPALTKTTPGEPLSEREISEVAWGIQLLDSLKRDARDEELRTLLNEGQRLGHLNMNRLKDFAHMRWTVAHWCATAPENRGLAADRCLPILLEYNVDLSISDFWGNTPLLWAIANANNRKALVLIQRGKGDFLNIQDAHHRNTALHLAVGKGYTDKSADGQRLTVSNLQLVQALIEKKADVNLKNREGNTPLHLAYARRDRGMIDALLKAGADPEVRNDAGQRPADLWHLGYQSAKELLQNTVGVFLLDKTQYVRSPAI